MGTQLHLAPNCNELRAWQMHRRDRDSRLSKGALETTPRGMLQIKAGRLPPN